MVSEESDDLILWSMLQRGESRGISLLYQRHYLLMLNYGLKLYTDRDVVKDAIQDVFVKLHVAKNISIPISPRSYLLKALRNTLYDKINTESNLLSLDNCQFNIVDVQFDLSDLFKQDDEDINTLRKVSSAYSKLNDNQKQIIYLRYINGLSYNEIADVMVMNRQSAMNLVQRSLVKLRTLMTVILTILTI